MKTTTLANGTFFGRSTAPLEIGGVTLAETSYASGFIVPLHDHAHPIFCLGLAGRFTERLERTSARLGARSVFFQPAGEPHAETFEAGSARLFNVQLGATWLRDMATYQLQLPSAPLSTTRGRLSSLAAQLHAEYRVRDDALRLAIDGILLSMIAEITRATARCERSRQPAWLRTAIDVLHERYRESIGLSELAAAAGVDPSHLAHTFRARMGCTVGGYVRALRLEHARTALMHTDESLARIALDAGFADQSHLTRAFRAAFGTTPAEYRRRAR